MVTRTELPGNLYAQAVDHQLNRRWRDAAHLYADESFLSRPYRFIARLNQAICWLWSRDNGRVLREIDELRSDGEGLASLELVATSAQELHRTLNAMEIIAADAEGESPRIRRAALEISRSGFEVGQLPRLPVAVVWSRPRVEILEDVVFIGDVLIPLALKTGGLRTSKEERDEIEKLKRAYALLRREGLEPLTTRIEQLASAIGLPCVDERRYWFTPSEWKQNDDGFMATLPASLDQSTALDSPGYVEDIWPGLHDQLIEGFFRLQHLVDELGPTGSVKQYAALYYAVKEVVEHVPAPIATVHTGGCIYRARDVSGGRVQSRQDISYHPFPAQVRRFGRANAPGESIFYGAVNAKTAAAEVLDSWFQSGREGERRTVLVGRWLIKSPFKVAVVPFHDEALAKSSYRRDVLAGLTAHLHDNFRPPTQRLMKEVLHYFAREYAKPAVHETDYWLTTAHFNLMLNPHTWLTDDPLAVPQGVSYPSVRMEYQGDNFALTPTAVDRFLVLVDIQELKFTRGDNDRILMEGQAPMWFGGRDGIFGFEHNASGV